MIEVEIRGPINKKKFDELKELFTQAAENVHDEKRVLIDYSPDGLEERTLDIRLKQKGNIPEICIKTGTAGNWGEREEIVTKLAPGEFSNAVKVFAAFGYKKGIVCVREMLHCKYGGANFTLVDPGDEDLYFYEADFEVNDPVAAKEAKAKLEQLARTLKLPIWNDKEMFAFIRKLNETVNYQYDFESHGADHFKDKFGI